MLSIRNLLPALVLLLAFLSGCSAIQPSPSQDMPPILNQDELIRPYIKLGKIAVMREVYGIADVELKPSIKEWGNAVIRAEAGKMGADAVILPEVTGTTRTYLVLPSTEYRATGVAIKFK